MQILIQHKNVKAVDAQDRLVEQRLFALADELQIDEAHVQLERQWESTPPYRASIHLVTPGPDVTAEGSDQTLHAAVVKALQNLERKTRARADRVRQRQRSNLQSPAARRGGRLAR